MAARKRELPSYISLYHYHPLTNNTVIGHKFTGESSPSHEVYGGTKTGYLEHSRPKYLGTESNNLKKLRHLCL